jgi:putative MATE family efflux protein
MALVSRRVGERDWPRASYQAWQGVGFSLVASLIVAAAFLSAQGTIFRFMNTIFRFMKTPPEVMTLGLSYLTVILYGLPALFLFFVLEAIFKGSGDAKTPMCILIFSLALNAALDPLLIFGWLGLPALGVAGAALASVLAHGIGCLIAFSRLPVFMRERPARSILSGLIPDLGLYKRIIQIGSPLSAASVFFCLVYVFLARITGHFGVAPLAALGVVHKLESTTYFTHVAFSEAAAALVGQNLGARKPDRAEACAWQSMRYAVYISTFAGLVFFLFPEFLMRIFTDDPDIIRAGVAYLRIVAFAQVFEGVDIVLEGAFVGAGNTIPPMLISIPASFARIPIAYFLAFSVFHSATGVWCAIASSMVLAGILIPLWFRRGKWKERKV